MPRGGIDMHLVSRVRNRLFGEPLAPCRVELLRRMPKGSVCAEVGVYKGQFSEHILKIVRPARLYLIDPWYYETSVAYERTWYGGKTGVNQAHMDSLYESVRRKFAREIADGTVVIVRAKSADALRSFPPGLLDWAYIDGNHSYEFVREDLELCLRAVKPGGFLAGDDYHLNGWWGDGVTRAVDEMRAVCTTRMILDGQFVLETPKDAARYAGAASGSFATIAPSSVAPGSTA
jgi:hypothetical protein